MTYEIKGADLPVLIMNLGLNESVKGTPGAMGWMNESIEIKTEMDGGLFKGLGRMMAGEKLFFSHFQSRSNVGMIAFPSSLPGKIIPLEMASGQTIIAQKGAYLCSTENVNLSIAFTKRFGAGLLGGEGFILQKIEGPGLAFFEIDGECIEYVLNPGEVMKVDTGHIAMFESTVSYEIEMMKGVKNVLFGGEGMFLAKLRGPGRIWLQGMPISKLAGKIVPFVPVSHS